MNNVLDTRQLTQVTLDERTNSFQVRWDNVLLLTAYGADETFILTRDGEKIVLQRKLHDVLTRFARENGIPNYLMAVLYDWVGCRTRGYVAGHYRLVPTCGVTNQQVVYYMVHHLEYADSLADDKGMMLIFKGRHRRIEAVVDTPPKTFQRIVAAADEVARIQLMTHEYCRYRYGKVDLEKMGERTYDSDYCVIEDRHQINSHIMEETILKVARLAFQETYGEEIDPEFLRSIKRVINRF